MAEKRNFPALVSYRIDNAIVRPPVLSPGLAPAGELPDQPQPDPESGA
jgi:hypothetical protein